ncbi:hypothetical protein JTB14_032483 [Gonioctena quinquepunctata]|nr:hypothetical protein JTB14_032483 [Gonioctena quinquepunctata]
MEINYFRQLVACSVLIVFVKCSVNDIEDTEKNLYDKELFYYPKKTRFFDDIGCKYIPTYSITPEVNERISISNHFKLQYPIFH